MYNLLPFVILLLLYLDHVHLAASAATSASKAPHTFALKRESHGSSFATNITSAQLRSKYLIPISFGDFPPLNIELDTGSSDTFLLATNYTCYHTFNNNTRHFEQPTNHSFCNSGPTYSPDSSFQTISAFYQETCYGSGKPTYRCMYGPFGHTDIHLAGLTISNATVGAPNSSSNYLLGATTSGILGLGFPAGTRAYATANDSAVHYPSILTTLFSSPSISPIFALALSRDATNASYGGIMTIGSLPNFDDPKVNITDFRPAVVPIEVYPNVSKTDLSFYYVTISSFKLGTQSLLSPQTHAIVDSGYNGLELPAAVAAAINTAWSPPASNMGTNLFLDCNATLPDFSIVLGGKAFGIKTTDLIGQMANGTCYSLVIAGPPPNGYSLGDPFLRNTLVGFDWGSAADGNAVKGQESAKRGGWGDWDGAGGKKRNASLLIWSRMEYDS